YDDYSYAVSIYTDPDGKGVKPTAAEMKPKAVKADTYSMLQPVIRWAAVPSDKINKVIGYRIQRVLSGKYEAALTDPTLWTTIDIYYDSPDKTIKTAFSKRAYLDTSIDKVGTYVYRVCGLYDKNVPLEGTDGKTDYTETKFDTVPLPVYGLGVAKQTGNDYRYGARIKFGIDKKDIELLKIPGIELTYTVETSDNGVDYTIFKTGKVDPNVQVYQFTDDNGGFELKRGIKRRYKVTITNGGIDEKGVPFNSMRGISYQKPTEIYLEDVPDTLVAGSGTRTIKISYNGTVCELDGEPETSDSSVLSIDSWDNDYVTVKPKKAGKAKITVKAYRYGWGGVTRTVTIEVKPKPVNNK
ncbi:MAG: hypothetical protein IKT17_10870, partial [Lachnospiraceae bacterium]|nr:hypothetical protein [Lachnospiraceae bacterium]